MAGVAVVPDGVFLVFGQGKKVPRISVMDRDQGNDTNFRSSAAFVLPGQFCGAPTITRTANQDYGRMQEDSEGGYRIISPPRPSVRRASKNQWSMSGGGKRSAGEYLLSSMEIGRGLPLVSSRVLCPRHRFVGRMADLCAAAALASIGGVAGSAVVITAFRGGHLRGLFRQEKSDSALQH